MQSATQQSLDAFYWRTGPCCAGCDWWRHHNAVMGDCTRNAPVSTDEREAMLGVSGMSKEPSAGHVLTFRHHRCGEFKDEFDWTSLPLAYRKQIGAITPNVKG